MYLKGIVRFQSRDQHLWKLNRSRGGEPLVSRTWVFPSTTTGRGLHNIALQYITNTLHYIINFNTKVTIQKKKNVRSIHVTRVQTVYRVQRQSPLLIKILLFICFNAYRLFCFILNFNLGWKGSYDWKSLISSTTP